MREHRERRVSRAWAAYWLALGLVNIAGAVLTYWASRAPFDREGRSDLWVLLIVVTGWILVDTVLALAGLYAIAGPVGRAVAKFNLAVLGPITVLGLLTFFYPLVFLGVAILAPLLLVVLAVGSIITLRLAQRRYGRISSQASAR